MRWHAAPACGFGNFGIARHAAESPCASSHTFQRTVASYLDEANAPLAEIANQFGHGDINVTATYLGRRQGVTRAASIL